MTVLHALMRAPEFDAKLTEFATARLVPALRIDPDISLWDSLAMADETLAGALNGKSGSSGQD